MSEYIAKASIEPRDYRVVFLIQKNTVPKNRVEERQTGLEPATPTLARSYSTN